MISWLKTMWQELAALWRGRGNRIDRTATDYDPMRAPLQRPPSGSNWQANWLTWPVVKDGRPFRVYVVEPREYRAADHADLFFSALSYLLSPRVNLAGPISPVPRATEIERFDLVTFPEAFLPSDALIRFLKAVGNAPRLGCVHVGLRPPKENASHMFRVEDLRQLVAELFQISDIVESDLQPFKAWIERNHGARRPVNIGCIFAKDANGKLRICLHPKSVRSKWEFGRLEQNQMLEGDLISLVTLSPTDKRYLSVTIQPLLCSDALQLDTDRAAGNPMRAVTGEAACLGNAPPDHVDIVTVAVCSPHVNYSAGRGDPYLRWHQEYLDAFVAAIRDDSFHRHHRAAFVLANFGRFPESETKSRAAGLSGAFVPFSAPDKGYADFVTIFEFGKSGDEDNQWSVRDRGSSTPDPNYSSLAHIVALSPDTAGNAIVASVFGFTLDRLPREANQWRGVHGVTGCKLAVAAATSPTTAIQFEERETQ